VQGSFACNYGQFRRWGLPVLAAAALIAPAIGCSEILGIQSDRHVPDSGVEPDAPVAGGDDAGADADATAMAGPWDCLNLPPEMLDHNATVDFTLLAYDAVKPFTESSDGGPDLSPITYTPLVGVSARACPDLLDPTCAAGTPWVVLSDAGLGDFKLQGDFAGMFEVQRSDLIPMNYYPGQMLAGEAAQVGSVSMMNGQSASLIGQELGVPLDLGPDSGSGMIFLGVYDCNDHRAAGVTFGISNGGAKTIVFYLQNGFPSTTASTTDSKLGGGGVVNVPAGTSTLTATLNGRNIGTANVVVRAGTIVQLSFRTRTR
jgi:hypothetical protein